MLNKADVGWCLPSAHTESCRFNDPFKFHPGFSCIYRLQHGFTIL